MEAQDSSALFAAAAAAPAVVVTGPTATGKTRLAVALARRFHGEVLSVDSRQLYRGLDLGTGKDLDEYRDGGPPVPYHLIDLAAPDERYDLFHFLAAARRALVEVNSRHCLPILCGGTPLYLHALLEGYAMEGGAADPEFRRSLDGKSLPELTALLRDTAPPELLRRTDCTQERRVIRALEIARAMQAGLPPPPPPLSRTLILAPLYTRAEVRERIRVRLDARLEAGLLDEVRRLHDVDGLSWEQLDWFGLEYRYAARHLSGQLTYLEMHDQLLNHIRQFAKRQDIWFRKMEREGRAIHWIPHGDPEAAAALVQEFLHPA